MIKKHNSFEAISLLGMLGMSQGLSLSGNGAKLPPRPERPSRYFISRYPRTHNSQLGWRSRVHDMAKPDRRRIIGAPSKYPSRSQAKVIAKCGLDPEAHQRIRRERFYDLHRSLLTR